MKKNLRLFLTMLFLTLLGGVNTVWASTYTIDMSTGSNGTSLDGTVIFTDFGSLTYGKGTASSAPAFYDNGSAVRFYAGNTITLNAGNNKITKVELTNTQAQVFGEGAFSVNGTYSYTSPVETWEGETNSLVITSSNKPRLTKIVVTYTPAGPIDPTVQLLQERVYVGQTMQIDYPNDLNVTFSSTNSGVATVDETGLITGVSSGTATISAVWTSSTTYNSGSQYFDITVVDAASFVRVTDENQLVAGNQYILVATSSEVAMGKPINSNKLRGCVNVTIVDNKVVVTGDDISILTLGGTSGAWTFQDETYLAYTGSSNELYIGTDPTSTTCQWLVTSDFQLQSKSNTNRYIQYNYNQGNSRFACYQSSLENAYLFVKEGSPIDDKADAEFAFDPTSASVELGSEFTEPTLTYAQGFDGTGTIVYASSNTNVATVDATTGEVTIIAAGTTTISATSQSTTNFKAGSASYTLTVTRPDYATLPFTFNGVKADIANTDGLTHSGLGSDYSASTAPNTKLKFDSQGDKLVLKFNEVPGILTFDIKGNSFSGGEFRVLTSPDGDDDTYEELKNYKTLGDTQSEKLILDADVRYIKWIYTKKSSGNVGVGNIKLTGVEKIDFATVGYKTYVTQNPIDWEATLERNNGENIDVHGYKAIRFSEADGVSLVEFGVKNQGSVSETDPMYQEAITPAGTPLVIMGKQGKNCLVISSVTPANAPVGNLFHAGDGNATTTLKDNGEIAEALYVLQKIDIDGSGIDNYKFYRLKPGRTVPEGKAYLSSKEITLPPLTPPNVNGVKSSYPMRVLEQNEEQLVSEDAGVVDGIGMNYQEKKDNVYYNVNGMRIANPSKGIYIVNGRKVVLK